MPRVYRPYIPQTLGDLLDKLAALMLDSPTFVDRTGYFPGKNLETSVGALNEGLRVMRCELGEARYRKLMELSDQMRTYFEADPEDIGDAKKGRALILEMEDLITGRTAP